MAWARSDGNIGQYPKSYRKCIGKVGTIPKGRVYPIETSRLRYLQSKRNHSLLGRDRKAIVQRNCLVRYQDKTDLRRFQKEIWRFQAVDRIARIFIFQFVQADMAELNSAINKVAPVIRKNKIRYHRHMDNIQFDWQVCHRCLERQSYIFV